MLKKIFFIPVLSALWLLSSCSQVPEFWNFANPSNSRTASNGSQTIQTGPVNNVALLLPLSGSMASSGQAVRDGFMAQAQTEASPVNIRIYDTNGKDILAVYRTAVSDGADAIVGPLEKNPVQTLATAPAGSIPAVKTLALNYSTVAPVPSNLAPVFYQFGLSPIDEAEQVAEHAYAQGKHSAMIIAPKGPWGMGVIDTFKRTFKAQGGAVVDQFVYMPGQDLGPYIKQLLHVNEGIQYERVMSSEMSSRHRQDADMIFLAALPPVARQINPLLKFYYAGDLPVYSISLIYSGVPNTSMDQDLNGIQFDDMPWVFTPEASTLSKVPRLYALGMDAYTLIVHYPNGQDIQDLNGNTGVLTFMKTPTGNRISRRLVWGQFQNGEAIQQ